MSGMQHTSARLAVRPGSICFRGGAREWVELAKMCSPMDYRASLAEHQANTERLAACWNACDGIPTDALQSGVADVMKAAEGLCRIYFEIAEGLIGQDKVRELRDKALEAQP